MSLSNNRFQMALDPVCAAHVRSQPQPPEEETRRLCEALQASTRRIFADFENATTFEDFKRIGDAFGVDAMTARRILRDDRRTP